MGRPGVAEITTNVYYVNLESLALPRHGKRSEMTTLQNLVEEWLRLDQVNNC